MTYKVFRKLSSSGTTESYEITWRDDAGLHRVTKETAEEAEAWIDTHPTPPRMKRKGKP